MPDGKLRDIDEAELDDIAGGMFPKPGKAPSPPPPPSAPSPGGPIPIPYPNLPS